MNAWIETIGIIIVALAGMFVGGFFSKLRQWYWILGYIIGFGIIGILLLPRLDASFSSTQSIFWLTASRVKFVLLCMAVTIGLTTPISRLPHKAEKVLTVTLMIIVVAWFCVLPILFPALLERKLSQIRPIFDSHGVCYQSTDYTCGPAAAVTALNKLGLEGHEGEIAIMSRSNPVTGTLPASLMGALEDLYSKDGLQCRYRKFESSAQLNEAGITLAMIKNAFLNDHCVAVIEVTKDKVTLADPVIGKMTMSHEHFETIWRHRGIVLSRQEPQKI